MRILASAHHLTASDDAVPPSSTAPPAADERLASEFILSSPAIIRREPVAAKVDAAIEPVRGGDQHGKEEP